MYNNVFLWLVTLLKTNCHKWSDYHLQYTKNLFKEKANNTFLQTLTYHWSEQQIKTTCLMFWQKETWFIETQNENLIMFNQGWWLIKSSSALISSFVNVYEQSTRSSMTRHQALSTVLFTIEAWTRMSNTIKYMISSIVI